MTTQIWEILALVLWGGAGGVALAEWVGPKIRRARREIVADQVATVAARAEIASRRTDPTDWDRSVDEALAVAEPTPDLRRVK